MFAILEDIFLYVEAYLFIEACIFGLDSCVLHYKTGIVYDGV